MAAVRSEGGVTYVKLGAIVIAAVLHTTALVVGSFTVFATNEKVNSHAAQDEKKLEKIEKDTKEYARLINKDTQNQLEEIKQSQKETQNIITKMYREGR